MIDRVSAERVPTRWPRALWRVTCTVTALALVLPSVTRAQQAPAVIAGAGVGGTYYCIVSRCDTGTTIIGVAGYAPLSFLLLEAGLRWHGCVDCTRFLITEATVQLQSPGGRVSPFVGAGIGLSSDPDFMGDQFGFHAAVGTWVWLSTRWGLQGEVRGRQVGPGDHMGEASVVLSHRFRRSRS